MSTIAYQIHGSDLQYVELQLPPNTAIIGEQGAMMYMDDQIEVTTVLGDGSASTYGAVGRFWKAIKRSLTGEALFSSRYSNPTQQTLRVAFAAPSVGKILAIDLSELGGELICQKGAYLAGEQGTEINIAWQKRISVGLFGKEGFMMQRITGQGVVFINATGTLNEITLAPGQALRVDSGCLVALNSTVSYEVKYTGGLKIAFFGGEGFFYTRVVGPGKVWLQSLPVNRLATGLMQYNMMGRRVGLGGRLFFLVFIIAILIFAIILVTTLPK